MLQEVELGHRDIRQLEPFVGPEHIQLVLEVAKTFRVWLGTRTIWNVSSTAVGGGVAEMLLPLLSYSRSLGVRTRWVVMSGNEAFFRVTKRVHHALHGSRGDGSPLGAEAHRIYRATSKANADALISRVSPGDIALLHDPQTAGLADPLLQHDVLVIWRCHIGHEEPLEEVQRGWAFLEPYLHSTPAYVFSSRGYAPTFAQEGKTHIIQPSIDALSPKNEELSGAQAQAILHRTGILAGPEPPALPTFTRTDASTAQVSRHADILTQGRLPACDTPLVVQVSRWDPLKDMAGVMRAFARLFDEGRAGDARLVLAGPDVRGVQDDPEGPAVFAAATSEWRGLHSEARERILLCMLPIDDIEENAAIVNALQRHATVITQKSLQEGFGLTVTEAMWKAKPVVASAVGGICDQIQHGVQGLLVEDPHDLATFNDCVHAFLRDHEGFARRCGRAAHERVREHFLGVRHLLQYADLMQRLRPQKPSAAAPRPYH